MVVGIVLGTRPEIIKFSSIMRELDRRGQEYKVIHTNQHYSSNLDSIFFEELGLVKPHFNLNVGSGTHGEQTGKMLIELEKVLQINNFKVILVQGDTNSVLAGALCASKMGLQVGHVEAGLRSYDRSMPEEINRVVTDHLSDFLFVPTEKSKITLINEGIEPEKIFVTGNTIVDAVNQNIEIAQKKSVILDELNLVAKEYFVLTIHRPASVDNPEILKKIFDAFILVSQSKQFPVIFPVHPRTANNLKKFGLEIPKNFIMVTPLGYFDFLKLEANAKLIFTDSGGVQEEACILKVPCVTIRENTERPETLEVGSSFLSGFETQKIFEGFQKMILRECNWSNPFGDGKSSERISNIILNHPGNSRKS